MGKRQGTVEDLGELRPAEEPAGTQGVVEEDVEDIWRRIGEWGKALEGRTLLVAGAGGFLPSYVLDVMAFANDRWLASPCRVVGVDNYVTGLPERAARLRGRKEFRFLCHDVTKPLRVDEKIDYVLQAASIASPPLYRCYPLETIDVNVLGTRRLLELARKKAARSFVYLSSSEVYGDPPTEAVPTPETYRGDVSCTGPRACYDESKRLAETLCLTYYRQFHLPVKIVRPFNVYGPRLRLDDGRVIPDFLRDALSGRPITLYSDGRSTRSFCYITDAVVAMLLLMLSEWDGEAFNVGNDEEVTIAAVAAQVDALFDQKLGMRFVRSADSDYLSDGPRRRCPDLAKVKRAISWRPVVSLREGLERTVRWYRERDQGR